tara:strand:+ start:620 stop:1456 length:837 start_codon:yes stop_codon:yes gene_type:complete
MKNLISVIITTKNRISKIERAINSVFNQSYKNIELIVVDDASSDGTPILIKSKYPNITLHENQKSVGGSASRNIGIKLCKGPFVAFLDDDDYFRLDKLSVQLELFLKNKQASLVVCNYYSIENNNTKVSRYRKNINHKYYYKNIYGGTSTYFTSLNLINKIGGFDEKLRSAQDWDFALKLSQIGNVLQTREPLVYFENYDNLVRISNSSVNTYFGHRDIFIKYGYLMNKENKNKLFFEVLYHRKMTYMNSKISLFIILKLLLKTSIFFSIKSLIKYYK